MTIRTPSVVSTNHPSHPSLPLPLPASKSDAEKQRQLAQAAIRQADRTKPTGKAVAAAPSGMAAATIGARDAQRWERVRAKLTVKLGPESFSSWFGRCRLESLDKGQVTVSVPTTFLKTWIRTHYGPLLLDLWQEQVGDVLRVDVIVRSAIRGSNGEHSCSAALETTAAARQTDSAASEQVAPNRAATHPAPYLSPAYGSAQGAAPLGRFGAGFAGSPLDPAFTFANFVEGTSNHMACSAARAVAEADGAAARFNPLFIHANVGLGKTHLLQAIAWGAKDRNAGVRTLYLTAEYFMWRFASAIRDQAALSFKESLRDIDLLLIDDMQFLQGKSIQQEFCHLLNALIDSAKQVVVAADREPGMLESLDERVKSRLRGGVALEIKSPELAMRESMLDLRYREAQREDPTLDIPDDVMSYVAGKVAASGRDVEGAFNQLLIQHRFSEGPLVIEQIERMLGHLVQSGESRKVRVEDIQKVVSRHYEVSRTDLLSNRRTRIIVRPRQIAMYLAEDADPAVLTRNRSPLRWARSYHRAPCGAQDRSPVGGRYQAGAGDRIAQAVDRGTRGLASEQSALDERPRPLNCCAASATLGDDISVGVTRTVARPHP